MTHPTSTTRVPTSIGRIVLATSNEGKIVELRNILGEDWELLGMAAVHAKAAEETGTTFEENSALKAEAVSSQTNLPTLADDSGLEIDALGGAPGVYSARYAGPDQDDAANRALVLSEMEAYATGSRGCRFVCVIALAIPGRRTITVRGTCEGTIGYLEIGTNGFGYDPLFILSDGRTMAQLDAAEKNQISHRAVAMRRIIPVLADALSSERSRC